MTCAGCDDCPTDRWHLHVTVRPHWSWSLRDVAGALEREIERHDIKPVVVTNHLRDGRSYRELIPTKHFEGSEADASRELFMMGMLLNNAGWRVRRLKIEGDARIVPNGRALYYEAHVKSPRVDVPLPRSTNARGENIYTVRRDRRLRVVTDVCNAFVDVLPRNRCASRPQSSTPTRARTGSGWSRG